MLLEILSLAFLIILPASLIWAIVTLVRFLRTPKEDTETRKTRKTALLISLAVTASLHVLSGVIIAVTMYFAVMYM